MKHNGIQSGGLRLLPTTGRAFGSAPYRSADLPGEDRTATGQALNAIQESKNESKNLRIQESKKGKTTLRKADFTREDQENFL